MQAAEALKPNPLELPPIKNSEKFQAGVEKIKVYLGDWVRDIDTANKKAKDQFDGDTALMHAAQDGVLPLLVGVGLESVLKGVLSKALTTGKLYVGKTPFRLDKQIVDDLAKLGNENPRLRYLLESTIKDLVVGITYNSMAHFSGRALNPAKAKHFLGSFVVSALDSMGPNGKKGVSIFEPKPLPTDPVYAANLLEKEARVRKEAFQSAPDPAEVYSESKQKWLTEFTQKREKIDADWKEVGKLHKLLGAFVAEQEQKFEANGKVVTDAIRKKWLEQFKNLHGKFAEKVMGLSDEELFDLIPTKFTSKQINDIKEGIEGAAIDAGAKAKERYDALLVEAINKSFRAKELKWLANHASEISKVQFNWSKLVGIVNPPVLKGLEEIVVGLGEFLVNIGEVRKVRQEKGVKGKRVEMPKEEKAWQRYGSSNWQDRNRQGGRR